MNDDRDHTPIIHPCHARVSVGSNGTSSRHVTDLQGLRDAALLLLGYDTGLRVSELVAVEGKHIEPQADGSATFFIPRSKTDQQQGAWASLSPDTMRRVGAWLEAGGIKEGLIFHRVDVDRRRARPAVDPVTYEAIPWNTRNWRECMDGRPAELARTTYSIGKASLTRQGVNGIYRRVATAAFDKGLTNLRASDLLNAVKQLSTHSLRVGLTQDLFAAGEDGVGIAQALRWNSPTTAIRYGRQLAVRSNVATDLGPSPRVEIRNVLHVRLRHISNFRQTDAC